MLKRFVQLFFFLLLLPSTVWAANVGFVPSTGIWFSDTTLTSGDTVQIYTAIMNSDYYSLNGVVVFYDNNQQLESTTVTNLAKGNAQILHISWMPTSGQHTLSARFTRAVAVDEAGKQTVLALSDINSLAGAPLAVNNATVNPVIPEGQLQQKLGNIIADVVGQPTSTRVEVPVGAMTVDVRSSGKTLAITSPNASVQSSDDLFAKNKAILDQAKGLSDSISSTAGKMNDAYTGGKAAAEQGKTLYAQAQGAWASVAPYVQKVEPYWNTISNHNEPKRIAIILGVIIVLYGVLRFSFRRRRGVFN